MKPLPDYELLVTTSSREERLRVIQLFIDHGRHAHGEDEDLTATDIDQLDDWGYSDYPNVAVQSDNRFDCDRGGYRYEKRRITAAKFLSTYGSDTAQATPANPANFIVDTGGDAMLSEMVQRACFKVGIGWPQGGTEAPLYLNETPKRLVIWRPHPQYGKCLRVAGNDDGSESFHVYSASTQMGQIARLLTPKPAPVGPKVHGHEVKYVKGDECVVIGCARVSVTLLRMLQRELAPLTAGNRTVASVTSDKGETITLASVMQIVAYVKAVDEFKA